MYYMSVCVSNSNRKVRTVRKITSMGTAFDSVFDVYAVLTVILSAFKVGTKNMNV